MVFEIDGKLCIDGWWLQLMEEGIQERAREYRAQGDEHGAQVLDRIAKSVDDVPMPLMMAYIHTFEAYDEDLDDFDPTPLTERLASTVPSWVTLSGLVLGTPLSTSRSFFAAPAAACWIDVNEPDHRQSTRPALQAIGDLQIVTAHNPISQRR
jgi:hypothetical protein